MTIREADAISVRDVWVQYRLRNARHYNLKRKIANGLARRPESVEVISALAGVSLNLGVGSRLGLSGPNGSGKTTLLAVMAGVLQPSSGSSHTSGRVMALLGGPDEGLDPEQTGRENVLSLGLRMGESIGSMNELLDDIREFSGLGDRFDHPVYTYSAGMQVRLRFSTLTAISADVLIVDEGIGAADPEFNDRAVDRLKSFYANSGTLVLSSHSEALLASHCDQWLTLRRGEIASETFSNEPTASPDRTRHVERPLRRLEFGFRPETEGEVADLGEQLLVVNAATFLTPDGIDRPALNDRLSQLHAKVASDPFMTAVTSPDRLYADLRSAIQSNRIPQSDEILRINDQFAAWQSAFSDLQDRTEAHSAPLLDLDATPKKFERRMYVRTGQVELWALQNYLFAPTEHLATTLKRVVDNLDNEPHMYSEPNPLLRTNWYDFRDTEYSIRVLMTNAGFYPNVDDPFQTFTDWAERYFRAIKHGVNFHLPMCDLHLASIEAVSAREGKFMKFCDFPDRRSFYTALADEKILFVTPLAREIQQLHESRQLFNLWTDVDVPNFDLTTLQMPVSTYPNRPHASWSDTFEEVCRQVDRAFSEGAFTMFMTASGCYGLPLSEYVFSRYGCTTIHYGNYLNSLFGIRQNRSEDWEASNKRLENWGVPLPSSAVNLDRIEGGCYLLSIEPGATS